MTDTEPEAEHSEDPESADSEGRADAGLDDEARRKFREALERKSAQEAGGAGGPGAPDQGKVHGRHGPAGTRRSFRRRGGG